MMRQAFSLCYELHFSEFFEEQPLFDNLLKLEDANGQTVLYHAIRSGDKDCVQAILSHGISPTSKFRSESVQRAPCMCRVHFDDSDAASMSNMEDCACQPARNIFPFLIMSLDLKPFLKISSQQPEVASQVSCVSEAALSSSDALGSYRILDVEMYNFSANDSKKMWQLCISNIELFSDNAVQVQGHVYTQMSFNPLQHNSNMKKCSLEMHSSLLRARDNFYDKESKDGMVYKMRRLMFFAFKLLSDGVKGSGFFQDLSHFASSSLGFVRSQLETAANKPFFSVSNDHLDCTTSLMFMLANSLFNCCVALKMDRCTNLQAASVGAASDTWGDVALRLIHASFCTFRALERLCPAAGDVVSDVFLQFSTHIF
jgi:hypothetical protein